MTPETKNIDANITENSNEPNNKPVNNKESDDNETRSNLWDGNSNKLINGYFNISSIRNILKVLLHKFNQNRHNYDIRNKSC